MRNLAVKASSRRYQDVAADKALGSTYTPIRLAQFVANRMVENAALEGQNTISILDPAIGDGELILALLNALKGKTTATLRVKGFDTNSLALDEAARRIQLEFPEVKLELTSVSFLDFILDNRNSGDSTIFSSPSLNPFDLIIANPPYVRTQIIGSERAQILANSFNLAGRVDLYQAFLLGIAQVLSPKGVTGIIASNRFMTTKGGGALRAALRHRVHLSEIFDLGDTKIFSAAVLPAVLIAKGTALTSAKTPRFISIYETNTHETIEATVPDPVEALQHAGIVSTLDGRCFNVRHGVLDASDDASEVWRLASETGNQWLATVNLHTWKRFGECGKIRVGVKTCADKIFIRHDWESILGAEVPELLRPLTTHHGAGRFRASIPKKARAILYTHEVIQGKRQAISLQNHPKSRAYLESHRDALESRSYVIEAKRQWYEIWVPQDPDIWSEPKLVFRDISERPTFWIDLEGSVVNGDCYWLVLSHKYDADLLWLACAVANSTFAEAFYDHKFNNKLYAGRRRFITQYVEQFPLPDPALAISKDIISRAKAIYNINHAPETYSMEKELDKLIWEVFGLGFEEIGR